MQKERICSYFLILMDDMSFLYPEIIFLRVSCFQLTLSSIPHYLQGIYVSRLLCNKFLIQIFIAIFKRKTLLFNVFYFRIHMFCWKIILLVLLFIVLGKLKQSAEAAFRRFSSKQVFLNIYKIPRKTPVPEPLFFPISKDCKFI